MIKKIEVEFKLSGEELSEELWRMDCDEQATFLCEVARILKGDTSCFLNQLLNISDVFNYGKEARNKASVIRMLETVLEYIKEEGEQND